MKNKILLMCLIMYTISIAFVMTACQSEKKEHEEGYITAVKNMLEISMSKESKVDFDSLAPSRVWEYVANSHDMQVKDLKESFEYCMQENWKEVEKKYGDATYSCKIVGTQSLDGEILQMIATEMEKEYGIGKESVKEAYQVTVYLEYDSEYEYEESENLITEEEVTFTVVNVDEKWYVVEYGYGEETSKFYIYFKFAEEIVGSCCEAWKDNYK